MKFPWGKKKKVKWVVCRREMRWRWQTKKKRIKIPFVWIGLSLFLVIVAFILGNNTPAIEAIDLTPQKGPSEEQQESIFNKSIAAKQEE